MSQSLSDRLSIDQIARLWATENEKAAFGAEDIATDLINAALRGDFQYSPKGDWCSSIPDETLDELLPITERQTSERTQTGTEGATWSSTIFPPTGAPANYDPRLAMLIETFDRDGNAINSSQLQTYLDARKSGPGTTDGETRQLVAREVFLSDAGLRRWVDGPDFAAWAKRRRLSRPMFIDLAGGDGADQASAVDQESENANNRPRKPPRKKPAKERHDRWINRAKILAGEARKSNKRVIVSQIARKIRSEDLKIKDEDTKGQAATEDTIRRVLTARQSEWDLPPES